MSIFSKIFGLGAEQELQPWQVQRLKLIGDVRRNAKKAARSGNPAKREPAKRVLAQIPAEIRRTHWGLR